MREAVGSIWDYITEGTSTGVCITTNGYVTKTGNAVMGAGIAKQAATKYPKLPETLGTILNTHKRAKGEENEHLWNLPYVMNVKPVIFSFPTKPAVVETSDLNFHIMEEYRDSTSGKKLPGWKAVSTLEIIERSAKHLVYLADQLGLESIVMPQPGCGKGGLEWVVVEEVIRPIFDDRFIVLMYQRRQQRG